MHRVRLLVVAFIVSTTAFSSSFDELGTLFKAGQGAHLSDFHTEELWNIGTCAWASHPSKEVAKALYFANLKRTCISAPDRIAVFSNTVPDLSEFKYLKDELLAMAKAYSIGSLYQKDGQVRMKYKYANRPALLSLTLNSGNLAARWEQDADEETDLMYCHFNVSDRVINP